MNYFDTFIEVAEDCPASTGVVPEPKGEKKTIAALQYEMLANRPYEYTQEDVLFESQAEHKSIPANERPVEREKFFSRSQACLRASALGKRYGWGLHHNTEGKIALYPVGSAEYQRLLNDPTLNHVKAMRSKRA